MFIQLFVLFRLYEYVHDFVTPSYETPCTRPCIHLIHCPTNTKRQPNKACFQFIPHRYLFICFLNFWKVNVTYLNDNTKSRTFKFEIIRILTIIITFNYAIKRGVWESTGKQQLFFQQPKVIHIYDIQEAIPFIIWFCKQIHGH